MEMALKSLRRRRLRTAFTVSGIVVGVALILVLLSLTGGTSTKANALINTLSPAQITVVNATGRTVVTRTDFQGGFGGGGGGGFAGGGFVVAAVVAAVRRRRSAPSSARPTPSTSRSPTPSVT